MIVEAPISVGELIDKITILEIKTERLTDEGKRANAVNELTLLEERRRAAGLEGSEPDALRDALKAVNGKLWAVEDDIRRCERDGDFGSRFVGLARDVYRLNDERFALKQKLNALTGSAIVEEKSYEPYR